MLAMPIFWSQPHTKKRRTLLSLHWASRHEVSIHFVLFQCKPSPIIPFLFSGASPQARYSRLPYHRPARSLGSASGTSSSSNSTRFLTPPISPAPGSQTLDEHSFRVQQRARSSSVNVLGNVDEHIRISNTLSDPGFYSAPPSPMSSSKCSCTFFSQTGNLKHCYFH